MKIFHRSCVALTITIGYTLSAIFLLAAVAFAAGDKTDYKFDFASGQAGAGTYSVSSNHGVHQRPRLRVRSWIERHRRGSPWKERSARWILHERQALLLFGRPAGGQLQRDCRCRRLGRGHEHYDQGRIAPPDGREGDHQAR